VLRSTVSTPHTSISELWISVGVFPRNVSILMYARCSSLVTVPETRTATISTLCLFHVHTPPETKYTALASRSSPVQLLKLRDRWRHYLRGVTNACISFEITLVFFSLSALKVHFRVLPNFWSAHESRKITLNYRYVFRFIRLFIAAQNIAIICTDG